MIGSVASSLFYWVFTFTFTHDKLRTFIGRQDINLNLREDRMRCIDLNLDDFSMIIKRPVIHFLSRRKTAENNEAAQKSPPSEEH